METVACNPGLDGVVVGESSICQIDEIKGSLRYRGYAIEDLAEQATYEEVAFLLLHGELPSSRELHLWQLELAHSGSLPIPVRQFLETVPRTLRMFRMRPISEKPYGCLLECLFCLAGRFGPGTIILYCRRVQPSQLPKLSCIC